MDREYFNKVVGVLSSETGLDQNTSEELVSLFYSKASEIIVLAQASYKENNMVEFKEHIHKIKGSAGNVRAAEISEIAFQTEELMKQDPASDLQSNLDKMEELISKLGS